MREQTAGLIARRQPVLLAKKKQDVGGKYSVDGAILVLEQTDGSQMPGLVTLGKDGFNFKLYGGPPDDPGLDFKK